MHLTVVGTGYVGLVAGPCFADTGNDVICVDIDEKKIAALRTGRIPIYEPGLAELVRRNVAEGRLSFSTDLAAAIQESKVVFVAVGTPPGADGFADLSQVQNVVREVAEHAVHPMVIVIKSTVPVGTADRCQELADELATHPCSIVSNPEFLKEGAAIDDFLKPDRVVIGVRTPEAADVMRELYAPFVRTGNPILVMDNRSAEMSKYAANAMLATKISFMNEMATLCETVGADITVIREAIGGDRRIGPHFLFAGLGYGGSCFPKDVQALVRTGQSYRCGMEILQAVEAVNRRQKVSMVAKMRDHFGSQLSRLTVAVWGLAFKPQTDDMREAPAVTTIGRLLEAGCKIQAYDPVAMDSARAIFGDQVTYAGHAYEALKEADALIICTEWNEFRTPDFPRMRQVMRQPVVFDGRNLYAPERMRKHGFFYFSIGRAPIAPISSTAV